MTPAVQQFAISAGKCIVPQPPCKNHGFGCYVVHKKQRMGGEVFAGTSALGFLGTAISLPRPIRPYRRRVTLWGISPRLSSSRRKQGGSVVVWQRVGCTAACPPEQSGVISKSTNRVNISEAALLAPANTTFSTTYHG